MGQTQGRKTKRHFYPYTQSNAKHSFDMCQKIMHLHQLALLTPRLSHLYNYELVYFARQQQIRLHKSIKHLICKRCYHTLLTCGRCEVDKRLYNQCSFCGNIICVGRII